MPQVDDLEHKRQKIDKRVRRQEVIFSPEEAEKELQKAFRFQDIPPHPRIKTLVVASGSPVKYEIISDLLRPLGVSVLYPKDALADEEAIKRDLQELETPDYKYAARMSARKLIPFTQQINQGTPTIALDTIVSHNRQVLEKPKTLDEARSMVRNVTTGRNLSRRVNVFNGLTFATQVSENEALYWRDNVAVNMQLKDITDKEVDEYLEQAGDTVLNIAGGIDYSSEIGQNLVENDQGGGRFTVLRTRFGRVYDLKVSTRIPEDQFDYRILSQESYMILEPYFKGVPTHLVKALVETGN